MTFQEGFGRHAVRLKEWAEVQESALDDNEPASAPTPESASNPDRPQANPAFCLEEDEEKRKPMLGWQVRFSGVAALFLCMLVMMSFVLAH